MFETTAHVQINCLHRNKSYKTTQNSHILKIWPSKLKCELPSNDSRSFVLENKRKNRGIAILYLRFGVAVVVGMFGYTLALFFTVKTHFLLFYLLGICSKYRLN